MKKLRETTAECWFKGNLVEAGAKIEMTDAEAKYLPVSLVEVKAEEPAAEPVVETPKAEDDERPVEKPSRRRPRVEASDGERD